MRTSSALAFDSQYISGVASLVRIETPSSLCRLGSGKSFFAEFAIAHGPACWLVL